MTPLSSSQRQGLTLPEVLLGLLLIVLGVMALISVLTFSLRARPKADERIEANLAGTSILNEKVRTLRDHFNQPVASPRQPAPAPFDTYELEYQVDESVEDPPDGKLKRVTVTVFWQDKQGERLLELWTLVSREG